MRDKSNDGKIDPYGILALQDEILKIAIYLDELCKKNGIQYFLMGGSALGAIRHKGFIPWDDDLDVFMKPDDFNKFRKVFQCVGDKEKYYLQLMSERDGKIASAKLRMNNTSYIEKATMNLEIHQGIFVDIFILHNCPDSIIKQILQCCAAKYILTKGQGNKNTSYHGLKKIIVSFFKIFPKNFGIKFALSQLYKYDKKPTNKMCHFMGKAFFKEGIYNSSFFDKNIRVPFETVELCVPNNTDAYLKERFGDYMKLPPMDSIKKVQHSWKWDTKLDFSNYVNKNRCFDDERNLV